MKALLFALFLGTFAAAWSQEVVATIKEEAQKCAKALLAGDCDSVVAYTHPRIVKAMGGKEAMITALKQGMSQMQADGTRFLEATVGQPGNPKRIGAWMTSMIPQHLVLKVSGGKLYKDSSLLGISEDDGKHWVFVDLGGNVTKDQLGELFPELDNKIAIPEKKPPVFKKDEGA
jgi:hypothetical protein